jgi:transcriptional regulator with XRE-family HTH domain
MSLRNRLKHQLRNRQFRHAYADEHLNLSISTQIKVIREKQQMSQAALAGKVGTKQAGISRIESANYSGWSIALLRRLAEAFDLRLRVSFEEFGTLWKEVDGFDRASLERRKFDDDLEFKERSNEEPEKNVAQARPRSGFPTLLELAGQQFGDVPNWDVRLQTAEQAILFQYKDYKIGSLREMAGAGMPKATADDPNKGLSLVVPRPRPTPAINPIEDIKAAA